MNHRKTALIFLAVPAAIVMAGCSSAMPPYYVPVSDPVLGVCQQPAVLNLVSQDGEIDSANNTNPVAGNSPLSMSPQQQAGLASTARQLTGDASTVQALHPVLATALRYESGIFILASQGSNGYTTNDIAIAADRYTGEITSDCGSYQPGTRAPAPATATAKPANPGKPGPGVLDWFLVIAGGYLATVIVSSYVLARLDRRVERSRRRTGNQLIAAGLLWWVTLSFAAARAWRDRLEHVSMTSAERREDELRQANAALEAENKRLRELEDGMP